MRSERSFPRDLMTGLALLALLGLAGGCARTVLPDSAVDAYDDPDLELDFWDELADRRVVTNNDALNGLLMVAADEVPEGYEARVAIARGRGWIGAETPPANESATVGMISVAVCDILELKGGVTMRLLGPSPRYCARELVYLRLIPPRTENQSLSGLEFIDLLGRAEDLQARTPPPEPT